MSAARYGHERVVDVLLQHGAEVNLRNKDGVTPLMYFGRGWTALMSAACSGCPAVVLRLLRAGADTSARLYGHGLHATALPWSLAR